MFRLYLSLLFVLGFAFSAMAVDDFPADGYDYRSALSKFAADNAATVKKTEEEWDATRTNWLEYVVGPFVKNGSVMGAHEIKQKRVFKSNSEHAGRVVEQSVMSWHSASNPGVYMSLEKLREKYPEFQGTTGTKPAGSDFSRSIQFVKAMHQLKSQILERRKTSLAAWKNLSARSDEMSALYAKERETMAKKWAEFNLPGSEQKGEVRFDPYSGTFFSDDGNSSSGPGVHIAADERLIWEMENVARSEAEWRKGLEQALADDQKQRRETDELLRSFISLKKALAALQRVRSGKPSPGDDELIKRGQQVLDSCR